MTPTDHYFHRFLIERLPFQSFEVCGHPFDPGFRIISARGVWVELNTHEETCRHVSILAGEWIAAHWYRNPEERDQEANRVEMLHTVRNKIGPPYDTQAALQAANVMYDELVQWEFYESDDEEVR
ncbi:MAG: hypothetical protein J0M26_20485 [Planctomycetes bacterium]|nr:hypothetical protein [Planctomycetota bacterium]